MNRQYPIRGLIEELVVAVLTCFLVGTAARAADLPQDLTASLAACNAAKVQLGLWLTDTDDDPAKRFAFGRKSVVELGATSSRDLRSLTVWVGGKQQLEVKEAELQSFVNDRSRTRISLLRTVATATTTGAVPNSGDKALPLTPGEDNKVTVVAWAEVNGTAACGSVERTYPMARIDIFALVIGFNYPELDQRLKYATKDAAGIVSHLVNALGVKQENIWLFTDDAQPSTTQPPKVNFRTADTPNAIRKTVSEILAKADPQSSLYVYFSGHMVWPEDTVDQRRGPAFVLPGSKIDDLDTMLNRSSFVQSVSTAQLSSVAVILDACFSGTAVAFHAAPPMPGRPGSKSWRKPSSSVSVPAEFWTGRGARLASSQGGDPSWELEQFEHGVFTHYLLAAGKDKPRLKLSEAMNEAIEGMEGLKPQGWDELIKQKPSTAYFEGGENIPWRAKQ